MLNTRLGYPRRPIGQCNRQTDMRCTTYHRMPPPRADHAARLYNNGTKGSRQHQQPHPPCSHAAWTRTGRLAQARQRKASAMVTQMIGNPESSRARPIVGVMGLALGPFRHQASSDHYGSLPPELSLRLNGLLCRHLLWACGCGCSMNCRLIPMSKYQPTFDIRCTKYEGPCQFSIHINTDRQLP